MRRNLILAPLAAAAGLLATPAMASEDTQNWQTVTVNIALPDNFKLQSETVARSGDAKGFYELESTLSVAARSTRP